jgi:hypothetical protein
MGELGRRCCICLVAPLPQVVERKEVVMSPIEGAVYNMRGKNKELLELIAAMDNAPVDGTVDMGPLTMQLSGVIDAAVQVRRGVACPILMCRTLPHIRWNGRCLLLTV